MKKLTTMYAVMAVLALLCLGGSPAFAEWTVVSLNPAGAGWSIAYGVSGGQQVGTAYVASLWSGTAESWVDLRPAGSDRSYAMGVSDGRQVGWAHLDSGGEHAGLWSGSAESWVDLNPGGVVPFSRAYGISGDQQVGYAYVGGANHATLWSGSAASWVDLNPAEAVDSFAYGMSDGEQVGYADTLGGRRASLWKGTAASWVNLNPAGATGSEAKGVSGGQQVGYASFSVGSPGTAALWSGSAASWVDLNPAGAEWSCANGVSGGKQVGYAMIGSNSRAGLWSGSAASWVDLHALLPAGVYTESSANGIDVSAGEIWVVGYARNTSTSGLEAMLWHYTDESVPTPVEQIQQILEFTGDSVADETLEGVGSGKSADKKLGAFVNMLELAEYLIISEDYDIACDQLTDILSKCDGQSLPPDFVEGDAADNLAIMIQELKTELGEML